MMMMSMVIGWCHARAPGSECTFEAPLIIYDDDDDDDDDDGDGDDDD